MRINQHAQVKNFSQQFRRKDFPRRSNLDCSPFFQQHHFVCEFCREIDVMRHDDGSGVTLVSASTASGKEGKSKKKTGGNLASAKEIGKLVAQRAQEKGIKKVVFDRGGYLYHGRIKALADAAREAGLEF